MVLKCFFVFLPYKPKHCLFLPNKNRKKIIAEISHYLLWRNNRPGMANLRLEPHRALCPCSCCSSYANTAFIRVEVATICTNCSPWKSGCDLTHALRGSVLCGLCKHTYTRERIYATHVFLTVLRGSVLCGLCKHIYMQAHLRDTRVSYCVAWKGALWFVQERHTQATTFTRLCKFLSLSFWCVIFTVQ